jgi:phenolic acid decarboxylase
MHASFVFEENHYLHILFFPRGIQNRQSIFACFTSYERSLWVQEKQNTYTGELTLAKVTYILGMS